jgi:hypothetical protein
MPVEITTADVRREREEEAEAVLGSVSTGFAVDDPTPWVKAAERMTADPEFSARMLAARYVLEMGGKTEEEWIAEDYHLFNTEDDEYYRGEVIESFTARGNAARKWPLVKRALAGLTEEGSYSGTITEVEGDSWKLAEIGCPECEMLMRVDCQNGGLFGIGFQHVEMDKARTAGCRMTRGKMLDFLNLSAFGRDGGFDLSFLDDGDQAVAEPEWLVEGMFCRGDYWSLFGPSEVGKSLLALDWALQMARNGIRVLYLDMENPSHVLKARFKKMGAKYEDFVNLRLEQFPEMGDLALAAGAKQLHEKVDKHKAEVVILDTISKFSQTGQATHSDRWQKMYNESFKPLLAKGISIGQLDHTGLSDKTRERDSSAKRDNVSVAWAVTWRGKDKLTMTRAKNRPNYQSPGSIAVQRVDEPFLTHHYGQSVPDEIRRALEELDRLGVPEKAGRPTARTALASAGIAMDDKVLEQAIRVRKGV